MNEIENLKKKISGLEKELKETKEVSRKYLQNVAHQLTAPLGAIKWNIEALKNPSVPITKKSNLLRSVYSQATILVHLIKNFALMTNLEADLELGQFREPPEAVDIQRLAVDLASDFQPQAQDAEKNIVVDDSSFIKALGFKKILIEKNMVAQAISNLLENAVKYADKETDILVLAEHIENSFGISIISVGIPIKKDEYGKLLERGFRGDAARQKVPAGTGFGLYLVSRVMQLHEGKIIINSTGKRSCFKLIFPTYRIV